MYAAIRVLLSLFLACITLLCCTIVAAGVLILLGFRGDATFPVDCGLVFGAAITGRNTAGPAIIRRVDGAARLWHDGHVQTLILTGGKGDSWRLSEASVMRQHAIRQGVDGRSILIEDAARSTKENLERSRAIVDEHCASVVAISDQYHLARIRLLAKKAGWGTLHTYGVPSRPLHGEAWSIVREVAAYMYYAVGADRWLSFDRYDDGTQEPDGTASQ